MSGRSDVVQEEERVLRLDLNEGAAPPRELVRALAAQRGDAMRRYPRASALEAALAARHGVAPEQVLVTAGGDEALDRIVRVHLAGRRAILPVPTFEMIERYGAAERVRFDRVAWTRGPFPRAAVVRAIGRDTAGLFVVSPNNPTGLVATAADLRALARAAPRALLVVDLAYAEFAADDLTSVALALPDAVVVRTFSKAWGLAGLRVGWVAGPRARIEPLREGSPFPVAGTSLAVAAACLALPRAALRVRVARVRAEERALRRELGRQGVACEPSQGNFVLARVRDARFARLALAAAGVVVKRWSGRDHLDDALRITLPGEAASFRRLVAALRTVFAPEALLLDLDGVVADVSRSYRRAIVATAARFGVDVTADEIVAAKDAGDANDDWELTRRLLARRGRRVALAAVEREFERLYQGSDARPGLRAAERSLIAPRELAALSRRLPLAIVTGRPRRDAERFLREQRIARFFRVVVAREDAAPKPDPAPVALALRRLGVSRAWMAGDTRDDVDAARAAGVVPIGVVPPGDSLERLAPVLCSAGAAMVVPRVGAIAELLP